MNLDMWIERFFGDVAHTQPEFENWCISHQPKSITAELRLGKSEFYTRVRTSGASNGINLMYDLVHGNGFGDYPTCLAREDKAETRRATILNVYNWLTILEKEIKQSSEGRRDIKVGLVKPGRRFLGEKEIIDEYTLAGYLSECKKVNERRARERAARNFTLSGEVYAF